MPSRAMRNQSSSGSGPFPRMRRRNFLGIAGLTATALATGCQTFTSAHDIIDCHTHFYDPTRPQGVPWPPRNEARLYRRVLPADYIALASPHGVTGTVVVEASPWVEDNQWVLDLAKDEPFIKGFVGNLQPGAEDFARNVRRFAKDRLFRGIRVSGAAVSRLAEPARLRDVRLLVELDLSLDVNGGVASLPDVAALARIVPTLRIVIDHVANLRIDGKAPPESWLHGMRAVGNQPNVFCKVSGLVEGAGQGDRPAPREVEFYRPVLDHVWNCFGEDRMIYGSNWPVSELFADFATVRGIVQRYFAEKGERATRKFFAENARTAYQWRRR